MIQELCVRVARACVPPEVRGEGRRQRGGPTAVSDRGGEVSGTVQRGRWAARRTDPGGRRLLRGDPEGESLRMDFGHCAVTVGLLIV